MERRPFLLLVLESGAASSTVPASTPTSSMSCDETLDVLGYIVIDRAGDGSLYCLKATEP